MATCTWQATNKTVPSARHNIPISRKLGKTQKTDTLVRHNFDIGVIGGSNSSMESISELISSIVL